MGLRKQGTRTGHGAAPDIGRSESTSMDASQQAEMEHFRESIKQRKQRVKRRRSQRTKEIHAAHCARTSKLNSKIKQRVAEHDERVRTIRRANVQYLLDLFARKSELRALINASYAELREAFVSTTGQLKLALDGRVEELI